MSYEGYTEHLCINGHYSAYDVYCQHPGRCPHCDGAYRYSHGVDQTNGYDEEFEYSCEGPKREIGHEDVWHEDHLGNRYATKLMRYEPLGKGVWVKINSQGHATPPYQDDLTQGIEAAKPSRRETGSTEGESLVAKPCAQKDQS